MRLQPPETLQDPLLDVMNFLNEVTLWYPSAISFAPGRPAEQFFDVQAGLAYISRYTEHIALQMGQSHSTVLNRLGQYQKTNGIINDLLCQFLANDEHIQTSPDAIMLTDGCQEGMTILLAGLFKRDRDVLLVIDPTYTGITGIASVLGVELYSIPGNWSGIDLNLLAQAIQHVRDQGKNPRALYVTPDFNNPLGTSMSIGDRKRLLALAAENQLLIFEDNAYGMFAYDCVPLPTLKLLDCEGVVIYLGTFSKLLFPALRLGFLVADQTVVNSEQAGTHYLAEDLSKVKSFTTVSTSGLLQAIVGGVLLETECSLRERIQEKVAFYRSNRDMMLRCLKETFGQDPFLAEHVTWNHPQGGFFLSVSLPFAFTKERMQACAEKYGVICCPMSFFSLLGRCEQQVRLSFSYVTGEEIKKGVFQFWQYVHDTVMESSK
ncbi:MAG TPA: PLP-dependent aminotransferase family protein [Ktedonobacteraceae bacterium]|nr:PLP-dependent aminotransferase family protein [Ktedonobacteraceae bacterium]